MTSGTEQARRVLRTLPWVLILLLGALALIRPILRITGIASEQGILDPRVTAIGVTVVVSVVWVAAVVVSEAERPFLTLVAAGLVYAVMSMVLSAVLSPILHDELQGPFAHPIAIPGILAVNALWGAVTGGIALVIRATRPRLS